MVIILRRCQRLPAFELTACFGSAGSGSAGNDLGDGGCPSILFKAFRMELKLTVLSNRMISANWNVGMLEYWKYWDDGLWNCRENDRHRKPFSLNDYKMVKSF
jgi:hypothetical protein